MLETKTYVREGSGTTNWGVIENGSIVNIMGSGIVNIDKIGKGVSVTKQGSVSLNITTVEDDAVFTLHGVGNLTFIHEPPENVILNNFGWVNIIKPKEAVKALEIDFNKKTTKVNNLNVSCIDRKVYLESDNVVDVYTGNSVVYQGSKQGNKLYVDGVERPYGHTDSTRKLLTSLGVIKDKKVQPPSSLLQGANNNYPKESLYKPASPVVKPLHSPSDNSLEKNPLNELDSITAKYIENLKRQPKKNSEIFKELNVTEDEEKKFFKGCSDPISFEIMDVPVKVYKNKYDLETVLTALKSDQLDPLTRVSFYKRDIKKCGKIIKHFNAGVKQLKEERAKNQLQNSLEESKKSDWEENQQIFKSNNF